MTVAIVIQLLRSLWHVYVLSD